MVDSDSSCEETHCIIEKVDDFVDIHVIREMHLSLIKCVREILKSRVCPIYFEQVYRICYNLFLHGCATPTYISIERCITLHVNNTIRRCLANLSGENFLLRVVEFWRDFKASIKMVEDVTLYLDTKYIKANRLKGVRELAYSRFCNNVFFADKIGSKFSDAIIEIFTNHRKNVHFSQATLRDTCAMLLDIEKPLYQTLIEEPIVDLTTTHYRNMCSILLRNENFLSYTKNVLHYVQKEVSFCSSCFIRDTTNKVKKTIMSIMVDSNFQKIIQFKSNDLLELIRNKDYRSLELVYTLFAKNYYSPNRFYAHFEEAMQKLINQSVTKSLSQSTKRDYIVCIESLYQFSLDCDYMLHNSFANDTHIQKIFSKVIGLFVNNFQMFAEYLSRYITLYLCNKRPTLSASIDDSVYERFTKIFNLLKNRDIFIKNYQKHLQKRLINRKYDYEKELLVRKFLVNQCGMLYTARIDDMIKDLEDSEINYSGLCEVLAGPIHQSGFGFEFKVLKKTNWDINHDVSLANLILPKHMKKLAEQFERAFVQKNKFKKIYINPLVSTVSIRWLPPRLEHERASQKALTIEVSTYQYLILDLFNQRASITLDELYQLTGIPSEHLLAAVYSMCLGKQCQRLLTKSSKDCFIRADDHFSLNSQFSTNEPTLHVQTMMLKERKFPSSGSDPRKCANASYMIRCFIVSTLKRATRLPKSEIIRLVEEQLRDKVKTTREHIQREIYSLVEGEYIRPDQDNEYYVYVL